MNLVLSIVLVFFVSYSAAFNEDPRNGLGLRPTVVVTSTSVSTLTCTKSTTMCTGRRRRDLLQEEDSNDQFLIVPSAVAGVEPTLEPVREGRAANPQQVLLLSPIYGYQPQSGIYNGNYRPVAVPYYGNYPPQIANDERLNLGLLSTISTLIASTSTSTVFSLTTFTSTPSCSTTGTFLQCPNA